MINYVIATWSGTRRNPSRDYLKAHLQRIGELKNNIDQITIVRPIRTEDDDDFYDINGICETYYSKTPIIKRYENDRSYGQFLYAYNRYKDEFDYYILAEDDYVPNIDNFDSLMIQTLKEKKCDYLCGSYSKIREDLPAYPRMNLGIVTASALERLVNNFPDPNIFDRKKVLDGQEQELWGKMFRESGLKVADWSDKYPVPYYDRYLRYFGDLRGKETIFAPYQFVYHKALGYHEEEGDESSHFLSTVLLKRVGNEILVSDEGKRIGKINVDEVKDRANFYGYVDYSHYQVVKERILYEYRGILNLSYNVGF